MILPNGSPNPNPITGAAAASFGSPLTSFPPRLFGAPEEQLRPAVYTPAVFHATVPQPPSSSSQSHYQISPPTESAPPSAQLSRMPQMHSFMMSINSGRQFQPPPVFQWQSTTPAVFGVVPPLPPSSSQSQSSMSGGGGGGGGGLKLRAPMPPALAAIVSPVLSLTCREGHGLVRISGKPARYGDWGCDLCKRPIAHDTQHVMHCDKCSAEGPIASGTANGFDICPECWARARDALGVAPRLLNAAGCPMFPGVGEYWQTMYCHKRFFGGCYPDFVCGPRNGQQCTECKRGQDALVASVEGRLTNRAGRVVQHTCFGARAGEFCCSECAEAGEQCGDCKFMQQHLP